MTVFSGNSLELTPLEAAVIRTLYAAHKDGYAELKAGELAKKCGQNTESIREVISQLIKLGLCDRTEDRHVASLSAAGIRAGKALISATGAGKDFSAKAPEEGREAARWTALWPEAVAGSQLSADEKASLTRLGEELFRHPRFPELLQRCMILAAQKGEE